MNCKLDYMERLFTKISNRKTEIYVTSRMWHQLVYYCVKFVVQQYVRITQDKYALSDLYLPQLNIFIEINAQYHKDETGILREIDRIRNEEILNITNYKSIIIDCSKTIQEIYHQIKDIVSLIKQRTQEEMGDNFQSWDDVSTLFVEYHRNKGYLKVDDNECLRTT